MLNVYQFNPADYMSYCGGIALIAAKTIERAREIAKEQSLKHIDEGKLFSDLAYLGKEGLLIDSLYFE